MAYTNTLGTFHAPPQNQGQIVVVSYTMIDGKVIRKTVDQSDRSVKYAISDAMETDEGDYWNDEPGNADWEPITAEHFENRRQSNATTQLPKPSRDAVWIRHTTARRVHMERVEPVLRMRAQLQRCRSRGDVGS